MSTVFEKLLSGEWPCAKVYEDDRIFAFMDAGQVNDGAVTLSQFNDLCGNCQTHRYTSTFMVFTPPVHQRAGKSRK